jgi:hypothetical protein
MDAKSSQFIHFCHYFAIISHSDSHAPPGFCRSAGLIAIKIFIEILSAKSTPSIIYMHITTANSYQTPVPIIGTIMVDKSLLCLERSKIMLLYYYSTTCLLAAAGFSILTSVGARVPIARHREHNVYSVTVETACSDSQTKRGRDTLGTVSLCQSSCFTSNKNSSLVGNTSDNLQKRTTCFGIKENKIFQ